MSAVVAYRFDRFAVVATDTRVRRGDRYRDDADKLWSFGLGNWAAGIGYDAILKAIAEELFRARDLDDSLARAERVWNVGASTLLTRFPDARQQIEGTTLVATVPRSEPDAPRWIVVSKEGARVIESRCVVLPGALAPHVPSYPFAFDDPRNDIRIPLNGTIRAAAAFLHVVSRRTPAVGPTADIAVSFLPGPHDPRPSLRFRGPAAKIARARDGRLGGYLHGEPWEADRFRHPPLRGGPREEIPFSSLMELLRLISDEET